VDSGGLAKVRTTNIECWGGRVEGDFLMRKASRQQSEMSKLVAIKELKKRTMTCLDKPLREIVLSLRSW
jgi:hypothetical protein